MSDATNPTPNQAVLSVQTQIKRDQMLQKLKAQAVAFFRPFGNTKPHDVDLEPSSATHMLSWKRSGGHDKGLYSQDTVNHLIDYIFALEEQLAIDALAFREKSIQSIIDNHHLDGFNKVV